jgi:hypothetical protein
MEKTSRARAEGGGMKKAREGEKVEFMSVSSCRASRPTELGVHTTSGDHAIMFDCQQRV